MEQVNIKDAIIAELVLAGQPMTVFQLRRTMGADSRIECEAIWAAINEMVSERLLQHSGSPFFNYELGFHGRERAERLIGDGLCASEALAALKAVRCPACDHQMGKHADQYGCQVERGDGYPAGASGETHVAQALGPCGCTGGNDPIAQAIIAVLKNARRQ